MASKKRNLQNIIVHKHFSKWDNDDVCTWLSSFGIGDVKEFVTYNITGKFLMTYVFDEFELDNLGFRNSLERKLFLHNLEAMQHTAEAHTNRMNFSADKSSSEVSNASHSSQRTIKSVKPAKPTILSPNESEAATENAYDSSDFEDNFYSKKYSKKAPKATIKSNSPSRSLVVPSSPIGTTSCSSSTSSSPDNDGPLQITRKIVEEELKWYWVSGSGLNSFFYMLVRKENGDKYKSGAEAKRCGLREGLDYVVNEFEWFELAVQRLGSTKYYVNPTQRVY